MDGRPQTDDEPTLDLMTPDELGTLLGLTPRGIRKMREQRTGPPWHRIGHRTIRYRRSEVDAWLESCRVAKDCKR